MVRQKVTHESLLLRTSSVVKLQVVEIFYMDSSLGVDFDHCENDESAKTKNIFNVGQIIDDQYCRENSGDCS